MMIRFFINYKGMLSLNVKDRREVILWKRQKRVAVVIILHQMIFLRKLKYISFL